MPELNNFSESSLKVISLAQEESHRLGHNFVGSEQLLLGLVGTESGAAQLLKAAGVSLETARAEVERVIGRGSGYVNTKSPFTPNARRAIDMAISTAREQGLPLVEPEQLLLAIIDTEGGLALKVLERLCASISQLRGSTLEQLQRPQQQAPQQARQPNQEINLLPAIPPVRRSAHKLVTITTLPQETGRWVAEVRAGGLLDGPSFSSLSYGDSDFEAIAQALESLARMYRDYKSGETRPM